MMSLSTGQEEAVEPVEQFILPSNGEAEVPLDRPGHIIVLT